MLTASCCRRFLPIDSLVIVHIKDSPIVAHKGSVKDVISITKQKLDEHSECELHREAHLRMYISEDDIIQFNNVFGRVTS
jgi:hypothetical protein